VRQVYDRNLPCPRCHVRCMPPLYVRGCPLLPCCVVRYVLTGNGTYLQAMLNAWGMLREHWILPGGSITINEGDYYPPDRLP
jgi:hypothetical protein